MQKPIRFKGIQIPEPCHEDWNKMTPEEKGRFCASCQKVVYDFTRTTEEEFNELVAEKGKVCGRFRADQIASNEPVEKPFWTTFRKYVASTGAVILFKMLTVQSSFAQTANTGGKGVEVQMPDLREKHEMRGNQTIKGEVVEKQKARKDEEQKRYGIREAEVTLQDEEGNVLAKTTTDVNGYFNLIIPDTVNWNQSLYIVANKDKKKHWLVEKFRTEASEISDNSFVALEMKVRKRRRYLYRRKTAYSSYLQGWW